MAQVHLSVVIPAYNEETNIRLGCLDKVYRYLERQSYSWEIIIVDDGSSDQTRNLATDFAKHNKGVTVLSKPHRGKASTVTDGMLTARGAIVLFSDLDQATPIGELDKILPWFDKGYDVVIGSRNAQREGAPLTRIIMARGFMMLRTFVLGLKGITDTQCGFKAFRKIAAQTIFERMSLLSSKAEVNRPMVSVGFDIEVLYLAKAYGYKIKEIGVEWHYVETRRVNPVTDSLQGLVDVVAIRLKALRGKYK